METVVLEPGTIEQEENDVYYPTQSPATIGNSCETSSWSSDTPLLTDDQICRERLSGQLQYEEKQILAYTNCYPDVKDTSYDVSDAFEEVMVDELSAKTDTTSIVHSTLSLAISGIEEVVPSFHNSIHVIGSGWEFGSVCSNPYRSNQDIRGSSATIDRQPHDLQGRLLSKIFKEKIASVDVVKGSGKDISVGFLASLEETGEEIPGQNNQKNLLIVSCGVMLLHIAIFGLRNLQSSLNSEQGIGVLSLAIMFGSFMACSLISPFMVRRFRPKFCLSISCVGHVFYVMANYYPTLYTMLPAAFLHGGSSALLWNALSTYVTEIGHAEAERKRKSTTNVLSRYFGVLFLTMQLAMVFGNLVSSVILSEPSRRRMGFVSNNSSTNISEVVIHALDSLPVSLQANATVSTPYCGVHQCDISDTTDIHHPVDDLEKVFLLGTYLSCAILAVLVIQCCLEPLSVYTTSAASVAEIAREAGAVLAMVFDRRFCFLVVMCLYTVVGNGFVVADVLKVFITCPLGMKMVGYSMICFGICGSVSSYIFGKLAKWISSITAFLIAGAMNVSCLALMFWWQPTGEDIYYLFAFIGAWGFADGIWQSQTNSLISSTFSDRYETAFGCCRVLQGLAGILVFSMSGVLCMTTKIVVTTATCLLAVILYIVMEILNRNHTVVTNVMTIDVK